MAKRIKGADELRDAGASDDPAAVHLDPLWSELRHLSLAEIIEAEVVRHVVRGRRRRAKSNPWRRT